jgi:NAD+ kinase
LNGLLDLIEDLGGVTVPVVAVFPHLKKEAAIPATHRLTDELVSCGYEVIMIEGDAQVVGLEAFGRKSSDVQAKADFGIVLGGDGALLQSARFLYPHGTPIFGINLGHLGLLTEFGAGQIADVVHLFYEGRYTLEERLMVYAEIRRGDQLLEPMVALNDIVVSKGALSRMLRLRTSIDGQLVVELSFTHKNHVYSLWNKQTKFRRINCITFFNYVFVKM